MGTEHHVHFVSRRGGIPAFLGIHKQASHLLGEASHAAKDSHQLNQLLTPLPTEKSKGKSFTPKLGLSREVEGVAGAQTGNTVCASLLQRPDPELGMRVYSLALAARTRAH